VLLGLVSVFKIRNVSPKIASSMALNANPVVMSVSAVRVQWATPEVVSGKLVAKNGFCGDRWLGGRSTVTSSRFTLRMFLTQRDAQHSLRIALHGHTRKYTQYVTETGPRSHHVFLHCLTWTVRVHYPRH